MRADRLIGLALATALATAVAAAQSRSASHADALFKNGRVYTMDAERSWAEAVAVKDGNIAYVGTNEEASKLAGAETRVVDLGGRMMLPGFIDTHNHAYLRTEGLFWVTVRTASLESYKEETQKFLARHPEARQVRGVGWSMPFVVEAAADKERLPRELLDDIVGRDIPAVFITDGHHEIWANTRAIENAGITKDTPDPPGAVIERDPTTGEPTGIFREFGAQNLVIRRLPEPDFSVDEFRQAILSFQTELAPPRGVTSVLVPTHYPTDNFLEALQALDGEGKLTVRYDVALWADETRGTAQIPELVERRGRYQGRYFKVDTIKIFGTGVGVNVDTRVWDQAALEEMVAALDRAGFRVFIHDIGPTSTYGFMLDAFEFAIERNGARDARHAITHVFANASPLAPRFKALGVRADGHPVPRAFFDAGVASTSSSDYPVRDFFPLTRVAAGVRSGVALDAMLASHTINGAELIFAERETGSIEAGKSADLVILDQDLFELPAAEIEGAKVVFTMFHGREVFRSSTLQ